MLPKVKTTNSLPPLSKPAVIDYHAVMVRLWRAEPDAPCRASVQLSPDEEPLLFANLPALFTYLSSLVGEEAKQQDRLDSL